MFRYYYGNHCKMNVHVPSPPSVAHELLVDINTLALPQWVWRVGRGGRGGGGGGAHLLPPTVSITSGGGGLIYYLPQWVWLVGRGGEGGGLISYLPQWVWRVGGGGGLISYLPQWVWRVGRGGGGGSSPTSHSVYDEWGGGWRGGRGYKRSAANWH